MDCIKVIASALPTFAYCYKNPESVTLPTQRELEAHAMDIVVKLQEAGFRIGEKVMSDDGML